MESDAATNTTNTTNTNTTTNKTEISFDADISQLMHLIINSFYSKKEIFLRELLSNASDALEKIRYESLTEKSVLDSESNLRIRVWVDSETKTLVIEDTGIGMTRNDLVHSLGTIARSGTKQFLENLSLNKENKGSTDVEQIGQFGVGFYSSYLVADNVKLYTKHNNDVEYVWESTSDKTYTIAVNETPRLTRGTQLHLSIKDELSEYLNINTVKETIKRYTEFINYPIEILESREIEEGDTPSTPTDKGVALGEGDDGDEGDTPSTPTDKGVALGEGDEPLIEDLNDDGVEGVSPSSKKVKKTIQEWKLLNDQKPIWSRKPEDVSVEEYTNFYKKAMNETTSPLSYKHFNTEGQLELNCLLYIPERPQMDMFESQTQTKKNNIKLYVKKVFITDECNDLVPEWLTFMKGVVDSTDIPLNVSREILQQNKVVKMIRNTIVKKSVELFTELSDDEEKYKTFYDNYSKMLKLGIHEDTKTREKLVELLRFYSSDHTENYITLSQYVENMKEDQESIYYITGQNRDAMSKSPFIEKLRSKGYDVLYFTDIIDEYMIQNLKDYKTKQLVDVSKDGLKFDDIKDELEKTKEDYKFVTEFIKKTLDKKVTDVKITDRLKSTPCILVTASFGWTANMERIMKAQALRNNQMDKFMGAQKILEINPNHNIMKTLKDKVNVEDNNKRCIDIVSLLYDTALLNSGFMLDTPTEYANKVNRLLELGFCDDVDDEEVVETVDTETVDTETVETENVENADSTMEDVD